MGALREIRDRAQSNKGSGMYKLWLKEGERATFWFMNDGEKAQVPYIHLLPVQGQNGRRDWTKDVACANADDDGTYCQLCEDQVQGPYPRLVMLTYVTDIFHPARDTKGAWEPVKGRDGTVYKESVNDYRLLIAKQKLQVQIEDVYDGDPEADDYTTRTKTLLDRPFQLIKSGSGAQAQELLRPGVAKEMPEAIAAALRDAPDIVAVVEAEFSDARATKATTKPGAGRDQGYDPSRIPADDEFDGPEAPADDGELEAFN